MTEITLPVTFTFIGTLAILLIFITGWIGVLRGKTGIIRGDGGHPALFKRIRIHGNLMENAPLFALLLGASELSGLAPTWLWLAAATFIIGRIWHYVLYDNTMRGLAMFITLLPGALMGGRLLMLAWG